MWMRENSPSSDSRQRKGTSVTSNDVSHVSGTPNQTQGGLTPATLASDTALLFDLNHALQHEVVTYATVGIQYYANQIYPQSIPPSSNQLDTPEPILDDHMMRIIVPEDFLLCNMEYFTLARSPLAELRKQMEKCSKTMTVSALKSVLTTYPISHANTIAPSREPSVASYVQETTLLDDLNLNIEVFGAPGRFSGTRPSSFSSYRSSRRMGFGGIYRRIGNMKRCCVVSPLDIIGICLMSICLLREELVQLHPLLKVLMLCPLALNSTLFNIFILKSITPYAIILCQISLYPP
jgi:hypothetical protein